MRPAVGPSGTECKRTPASQPHIARAAPFSGCLHSAVNSQVPPSGISPSKMGGQRRYCCSRPIGTAAQVSSTHSTHALILSGWNAVRPARAATTASKHPLSCSESQRQVFVGAEKRLPMQHASMWLQTALGHRVQTLSSVQSLEPASGLTGGVHAPHPALPTPKHSRTPRQKSMPRGRREITTQ